MRNLFLAVLFVNISFFSFAQMPQQPPRMSIGHIFGKVIDAKTKQPMSYTAVAILTPADSLLDGQLTEDNGEFSLSNLPFGKFKIRVTSMGYTTVFKDVIISMQSAEQDLGDLAMSLEATVLKDAVITADRSSVELKSDRKVVTVDKYVNSRGGTAMDVMKNVPGVAVDGEGNVTIRNNSPMIYIDGKPSQLTLDQIPADQIDRVEVITNPSAKFDAAATGGILNIILKHNVKPGYNGLVNMSIGTNNQYNGMALLNLRMKKFGFTASYNINSDINRPHTYTDRKNLNDTTGAITSSSYQDNNNQNKHIFQNARVGFDWYISNRNTLSISENITAGKFITNATQNYNSKDANDSILEQGARVNDQTAHFQNYTTNFDFKHTYAKQGREWDLMLMYTYNTGGTDYQFTTTDYDSVGNILANPELEKINAINKSHQFIGQWDFTNPLPKNGDLDFGVRFTYTHNPSVQNVQNYDYTTSEYEKDTLLSTQYNIDNLTGAAYVTYGQTVKKFQYQVGLRYEQTYFSARTAQGTYTYSYPESLAKIYESFFPSLNMSYAFDKKNQLQFNVSRKINRPNFFQISPFIFFSDRYNYQTGNPLIRPEFVTQGEVNYDLTLDKFNWLSSVYGRYNEQPITNYAYRESPTSDVLINTFGNSRFAYSYGWENTIRITAVKNLDISVNGNVYNTYIAAIPNETPSNSGWSYFIKGTISYKFPLDITAQINGTYNSARYIPQGYRIPMGFFDVSLSKDFMKVFTVNLTVSDVLNSNIGGTYYNTPEFTQMQTNRRKVRYGLLGISYKFGKMDASLFRKNKQKKNAPSGGGGDDEGGFQ